VKDGRRRSEPSERTIRAFNYRYWPSSFSRSRHRWQYDRDKHLRSPDILDVERFPKIRFRSTKVSEPGAGLKFTGTHAASVSGAPLAISICRSARASPGVAIGRLVSLPAPRKT
jgi:hypothetical protein